MATSTVRVMNERTLTSGDEMSLDEAQDLAPFDTLDLVIHVLSAAEGDAPSLTLKHAAFNEDGRYLDFAAAVTVDLSATGSHWFRIDAFTRYLGWFLSGTLTGDAVVTLDVVARG